MSVTIALLGDTMLGRLVGERLATVDPTQLVAPAVTTLLAAADLRVLNLECCISERGEPWPDPHKPFFFRAPPIAVETLTSMGVDIVTLANNHALDFGHTALLDTLGHLRAAGIAVVGAGPDLDAARRPVVLEVDDLRVGVIGVTDHPAEYAAGPDRPGVAHADLRRGTPGWLLDLVAEQDTDVVLVTPHWGPNMTTEPPGYVQRAADELLAAGASLIAGHSAHVFHGVRLPTAPSRAIAYDLGDFLDDYDLGLAGCRARQGLVGARASGPSSGAGRARVCWRGRACLRSQGMPRPMLTYATSPVWAGQLALSGLRTWVEAGRQASDRRNRRAVRHSGSGVWSGLRVEDVMPARGCEGQWLQRSGS
jgi:poly-gamma-glutamate capsule biosynthesis protein CapA/YwtB (metallophosphatase superfamily)